MILNYYVFAVGIILGLLTMSLVMWRLGIKHAFASWEFLCVLMLGVPMMIVGYFGTFIVNGVITGNRMYKSLHGPASADSSKTSP